ncbi:hypothetical protein EZS27_022037 [termite gut metagenome]|uniref:Uncharacterized protein n=1 Tax=termite gut metagenome TaxID=433724 RepID=A0A5J4R626_9ZZZZ
MPYKTKKRLLQGAVCFGLSSGDCFVTCKIYKKIKLTISEIKEDVNQCNYHLNKDF